MEPKYKYNLEIIFEGTRDNWYVDDYESYSIDIEVVKKEVIAQMTVHAWPVTEAH